MTLQITVENRAMNGRLTVLRFQTSIPISDIQILASDLQQALRVHLADQQVKLQLRCRANFHKATDAETTMTGFFISKAIPVYHCTAQNDVILSCINQIQSAIDAFIRLGSGWVVNFISYVDMYIYSFFQFAAFSHIELPKNIAMKRAIVNIQNKDNKCFVLSVLAHLHPQCHGQHNYHPSKYLCYEHELNLDGIDFPVKFSDIDRFEQQNKFAINVYAIGTRLFPLRISNSPNEVINLLFLRDSSGNTHYCYIKDFNRLMYSQTKHKARKFYCYKCLCGFNTEARLSEHRLFCVSSQQRIDMPEDGSFMTFRNYKNRERAPLVIYADFECFTETISTVKINPSASSTTKVQLHTANSFAALPVFSCCGQPSEHQIKLYRGEKPVEKFLTYILSEGDRYQCEYDYKQPMRISFKDRAEFSEAATCHICGENMYDALKVRDHCHLCGRFRGAAHYECNIRYWLTRDVVVVFHNLRRYDGHLILREIGRIASENDLELSCIPKSTEEYLTFSLSVKHTHTVATQADGNPKIVKWRIKFIDSFAFLPASLANLVENLLKTGKESFRNLRKHFPTDEQLRLCLRKGCYPYNRVTEWSCFNRTELFPPSDFFNNLTMEGISEADYAHAQEVWTTFGFRRFGDYHDLYLRTDVLLLADVFENFREFAMQYYQLDPLHYVSIPSFAWDAMLRMTGVKLELLTDPDMYIMLEAGIRGGISQISNRYAKANNKFMADYDTQQEPSFLMYLDMNNLYGTPLCSHLPVSGFRWARPSFDYISLPDDGSVGCILEVDLRYPRELHDQHNDYPLAPEKKRIDKLSPYSTKLAERLGLKPVLSEKLIPNFFDKERYVVRFSNLKYYVSQGMVVTKVHRVLKFRQECWMRQYIDFNTEQRKKGKSDFEKDLFKLLNNAVFGKSMENVRNRITLKLVTNESKFNELVASVLFKECHVFTEDLVGISMEKEAVQLNKPIYAGFAVLDLSKLLMYRFHYDYMVPKFGKRCMLMFTDTDSLLYHVKTDDFYDDIASDVDSRFDTSDYPSSHKIYSSKNRKLPGFMHDELGGRQVKEFVGLRSKMYSILCEDEQKKKAKGVKKAVVKKSINHEDYKKVLANGALLRHEMTEFRSDKHFIYTVDVNKISLSSFDDKRYVLDDGIHTLAYGHYAVE